MTPEDCIDMYNRITARLLRGRQRPASHSRRMLATAKQFLAWCADRAINPRHWIVARHEWTGWTHRIALSKMTDASPRFHEGWEEWIANRYAEWDAEKRDRAAVVPDTNRVEAMTVLGEAVKASYLSLHEEELCMVAGATLTGGYHPASKWCAGCRLADQCRDRLSATIRARRIPT